MTSTWLFLLCTLTTIGCALISGIFLTFSDFVMRAFKHSTPTTGIQAMQRINIEVWRSVFMVLLWGFLITTVVLTGYAYINMPNPITNYIMIGTGLYIVGVFGISFLFNIPMNERLAALDATTKQTALYWYQTYLPRWVFFNYLRAISACGTAACFLITSLQLAQI